MRVEQDVIAVLDRAAMSGSALTLVGTLDRKLYERTAKVIEAAGGKWSRKAKAHLFEGEAAEAIEPVLLTGEVVRTKQEFGQFFTPPDVARRVIEIAGLAPGMAVLEPSAGRGALAAPALLAGCKVDCVEIDPKNASILCSTPYRRVVEADFLSLDLSPSYDRVVMNPPFARQADIAHVLRAIEFVKPGGRLVAIMSNAVTFRTNGLTSGFKRRVIDEFGATIKHLPDGAFKPSGTAVNAVIVSFDVPSTPEGR